MSKSTIQDLKRGDRFKFNDETYIVTRKFIDDNRPLIARQENLNARHDFSWEGLEVEKLNKDQK
jgi:hypothetical protein